MPTLSSTLDYARAIKRAANGRIVAYPGALRSVLSARLKYQIGPRHHSLFRLFDAPTDDWGSFVIDERLRVVLRRLNPPERRIVVSDKLRFYEHCVQHQLPTVPVLCALDPLVKKGAPPPDPSRHSPPQSFLDCLGGAHDRLFFKLTNGTWGLHAFVASRQDGAWSVNGDRYGPEDVFRYCVRVTEGRRGWIVQPVVTAHSHLLQVTSKSALSTIRGITCINDGIASLQFAVLRIPAGQNITDNFAHGKSGNLLAPIDLDTGILGKGIGSADRDWPVIVEFERHPTTGHDIQGFRVPFWQEAKELMVRAHASLPQLKTLGWDIAITDEGPTIVEANSTYDVDLIQVAHGRGIAAELLPLLSRS